MDVTPLTLEGTHVRLEPMRLEHYERLAAIGLGQDIFRYFRIEIDTKEQMLAYVQQSVAATDSGEMLVWVTVSRELNAPVGATSYLNIDRRNPEARDRRHLDRAPVAAHRLQHVCKGHAFETLRASRV